MAVVKLTPDLNLIALIDFADQKQVPQARYCDDCGDEHHPRRTPGGGARYFIGELWLCVDCMLGRARLQK